jgi:Ca2+-dependent lipid-binding protein
VRCYIFQCKELPAADSDGKSDPYVEVYNMIGKNEKTEEIEDNLNPIFLTHLDINLEVRKENLAKYECYPPVLLNLFDSDPGLI